MRKTVFLLCLILLGLSFLYAKEIDFVSLSENEITPQMIDLILESNARMDRNAPGWDFVAGQDPVPVPLPRPGDLPFLEDLPWTKDFTSHITYGGVPYNPAIHPPLHLFFNTPTQRFEITRSLTNPLELTFSTRANMEHWYGSEIFIIGVSDQPSREPGRAYATAVVRLTVSPVDDHIIIDCPPEFTEYDEFGNITNYVISMQEDTQLTINFLNYNGEALIKTVDDLNDPGNYQFFITQTQMPPFDVNITQTPAYTGRTVTFSPMPNFFGEVVFTITNVDNNLNGFLDANPEFNTSLNVFKLRVTNVNDAPIIRPSSWLPTQLTQDIIQHQSLNFSAVTFDADDPYYKRLNSAHVTEMTYEWRITGFEYGVELNEVIPHTITQGVSPNQHDIIPSIAYQFNYPGTFQVSLTVRDSVVTLAPLVWTVNVAPVGPEFTLPAGIYIDPIEVGLFSSIYPDAPIYYTLDGSIPDINSNLFDPAFPIAIGLSNDDVIVQIRAILYDSTYGWSDITSQTYHLTGTVEAPVFNLLPLPHVYHTPQQLTITSNTVGSSIRYTLDGSIPTPTSGTLYTVPIVLPTISIPATQSGEHLVKAIAYKSNWLNSTVSTDTFKVTGKVVIENLNLDQNTAPHQHILAAGEVLAINVSGMLLYPNDANTRLYYTTNNTTPTERSTLFTGEPIYIGHSAILRFRAFRDDWAPSDEKLFEFIVNGQVLIADYSSGYVFSPAPDRIYTNQVTVRINNTLPISGGAVYYTVSTDPDVEPVDPEIVAPGLTPSNATRYVGGNQIVVPELNPYTESFLRIKARAYHNYLFPSNVYSAFYHVTGQVETPLLSHPGGTYAAPFNLNVISNAPGGRIRYTYSTDLSIEPADPTENDNVYTGSIFLPLGIRVIKVRVFKDGWEPSNVVTGIYYIGVLDPPYFVPVQALHYVPIDVSILHNDPEATVRWEYGNVEPDENSPVYTTPIPVSQTTTFTAKGFKPGWSNSPSVSKTYTITGTLSALRFGDPNLPGTYDDPVLVSIISDDDNVQIRYTTDNSIPTVNTGNVYSGPFVVASTSLIRAMAFKAQWIQSTMLEGLYEIVGSVNNPQFTPPPGLYTSPVNVQINTLTAGTQIRYTTDGSDPTQTTGILYNPINPIAVTQDTEIRAIAYFPGGNESDVVSGFYTITGTVAPPTFTPPSGTYASAQMVTIESATPDAIIFYTLDGTAPTSSSDIYNAPISVDQNTIIRAYATKADWIDSNETSATYIINGTVSTPFFLPTGGSYFDEQSVQVYVFPTDATVHYTIDGSAPNLSSPVYSHANPIAVDRSMLIRAIAVKPMWTGSSEGSADYSLALRAITANYDSNVYPNPIVLSLSHDNAGATIYYTIDDSFPLNIPQNLYTLPLAINSTTRVRAIAYRDGWVSSPEFDRYYVINPSINAPVFSVVAGTYNEEFLLGISVVPGDAVIYYTLDGSEPTESSLLYTAPFWINQNTLVRARAFKEVHQPSPFAEAQYYLKAIAPTANQVSGTYNNAFDLTLQTTTGMATIRYTTDGSNPSSVNGFDYSPQNISSNTTLKAIALKNNWLDSDISSYDYNFAVAPILFDPIAGAYPNAISVSLNTLTTGAEIRYTLNGAAPTSSSGDVYALPIDLNEPTTIRAIAYKNGYLDASAEAHFSFRLPQPLFSESAGTKYQAFSLSLSSPIAGTTILYTTDGSDPANFGLPYIAPLSVDMPKTVRAINTMAGWDNSLEASAAYQFKVATPTFSPVAGLYSTAQDITIASTTEFSQIRYTIDQSIPDDNSFLYSSPVHIELGQVVFKAIGKRAGWLDSDIGEAGYIIGTGGGATETTATPVFSPVSGVYNEAQTVSITSTTPTSSIRYTTDGSDPSPTHGELYTTPIVVSNSTTFRAIAYRTGFNNSPIAVGSYVISTIMQTVATPTFSPAAGTYFTAIDVELSSATPDAIIYYTTDGTDPSDTNGTIYNSAIPISSTTTIRAIAYKAGFNTSAISSAQYIINIFSQTVATPVFNPAGGSYDTEISVQITTLTPAATIYYTTDGTEPSDTNGTVYTSRININSTTTLKAKAYRAGYNSSDTATAVYNISSDLVVSTPYFYPVAGNYNTALNVGIYSITPGAVIYYTLDGSDPDDVNGILYTGLLELNSSATVKAKAYKIGYLSSQIATSIYNLNLSNPTVANPTFNPPTGTYSTALTIRISTITPAAAIYYTTDGTEPSSVNGLLYTDPFVISTSQTIRAIAYRAGYNTSQISSATYIIGASLPVVSTPNFTPPAGVYNSSQLVEINTITSGATIYYTTDGSVPNTNSMVYTNPILVSESLTIKAVATHPSYNPSAVASATYAINISTPVVATPTFTPAAGIYTLAQSVMISTTTPGSTIYYTTDGNDPSTSSSVYINAIPVDQTMTLKAFATAAGHSNSQIARADYVINIAVPTVATPSFNPPAGVYTATQNVVISSATAGAAIRYTTDGSEPTQTHGTLYSAPVVVSSSQTIKAIAYLAGHNNSLVASASYAINISTPVVTTPTFTPAAGLYSSAQTVIINTSTVGATIRYTTNGTDPSETNGSIYISPIVIDANTTLKAIAYLAGYTTSAINTGNYVIVYPTVSTPTFTPVAGVYTSAQSVLVSTTTAGATIRYTLDGTNPSQTVGTIYTDPIAIDQTTTIKAIAYLAGYNNSLVATASYVINITVPTVATPVFTPEAGIYSSPQTVNITTSTVGATIRYTTDGSDPTETIGMLYSAPITVNASQTIKAIAYLAGYNNSLVATASYVINIVVPTVANPVFTPPAGIYDSAVSVVITSATPGASIRYTIDGTNPSEISGTLYTDPIIVESSRTIKALAYLNGYENSQVISSPYFINISVPTVATPTFNPPAGVYNSVQTVAISTSTADATIRYTTDGSDPGVGIGFVYTTPITVATTQTVKAIAFKTGFTNSLIGSASYAITIPVVEAPVFTPPAGTYTTPQSVVISSATPEAAIRYTIDGTDPSETVGLVYNGAIPVSSSQVIKAIAFKPGLTNSQIVSASYNITGTVTLPIALFNPIPGTYQTSQSVILNNATNPAGAVLRYTTNGSDPDELSASYTTPIVLPLNSSTTIKVRAYSPGWIPSEIVSGTYIITGQVAQVQISPNGGDFTEQVQMTLSTTTPSAQIRYTIDGTDPTPTVGIPYTAPVGVNANTVIKAIAYRTNWTSSVISQANFQFNTQTPVFSINAGTYTTAQTLALSTPTANASIRYTTDGTDPTPTVGTVYSAPISISQTQTIKAIAYRGGWNNSPVISNTYVITGQAAIAVPTFNPAGGLYYTAQTVSINQSTQPASAVIRYTLDGSDPNESSPVYSAGIALNLNTTTTIRARAFAADWEPSPIYQASYQITGTAQIPDPVFNPAAGLYQTAQVVSINVSNVFPAGATIHYTMDGTEPDASSPVYNNPIVLATNSQTTIKAKAFKENWLPSATYTADYTITGTIVWNDGPRFDPIPGVYQSAQEVGIIALPNPSSAIVRYTTDGSDPTEASAEYTTAISIPLNTLLVTIKARAFRTDWLPSEIISGTYTVTGQVELAENPFLLAPGLYYTAQNLSLASPVLPADATIRYTINGEDPDALSPAYTAPIALSAPGDYQIKIRGFAFNWTDSPVFTALYRITGTVPDPIFSHTPAVYDTAFVLTISVPMESASIRYTLDGSEPDENSALYSEGIQIADFTQNLVVKAKAYRTDWLPSTLVEGTYSVLRLPINVRAYSYAGYIRVIWNSPVVAKQLNGFNVYRRRIGDNVYSMINSTLVTTYQDSIYFYDDYSIQNNQSYQYYVRAVYNGQESNPSSTTTIIYQIQDLFISDVTRAYPNPAESSTKIQVILSRNENVQISVSIFDFAGKKVRTINVPTTTANLIEIPWDLKTDSGTKVARGVYFARIVANDGVNRAERVIKIAVK